MTFKTDSEPLNRLRAVIQTNAHLLSEEDVNELNDIYKELESEYNSFENEVTMNEKLMDEMETLKTKTRMEMSK